MLLDLVELKNRLQVYTLQRDQAQVNFQQLCGAIFVLNEMLSALEENKSLPEDEGDKGHQPGEDCGQTQLPSAE